MNRTLSLMLFLVLVLGGGLVLGFLTTPGEWYAGLSKPAFNPPGWLFGPVWTVLYILIAIAGWRVWQRDRDRMADEALVGTARPELHVDAGVFRRPSDRTGARRHSPDARRHPRLHCDGNVGPNCSVSASVVVRATYPCLCRGRRRVGLRRRGGSSAKAFREHHPGCSILQRNEHITKTTHPLLNAIRHSLTVEFRQPLLRRKVLVPPRD